MLPFKVKVLNICTGGVVTNLSPKSIQTHNLALPHTSRYMPIDGYFRKRQGYSNDHAISSVDYAKQVVSAVCRARSGGWIWRGYFAWTCWFLDTFLWRTVFDWFMVREFGLNELRKILDRSKRREARD
jgi:1-acylglycerone phosphate reductase